MSDTRDPQWADRRRLFNERSHGYGTAMQDALMQEFAQHPDPRDLMAMFSAVMKLATSTYIAMYQTTLPEEEGGHIQKDDKEAMDAASSARTAATQLANMMIRDLQVVVGSANPFVAAEALGFTFQLVTVNAQTKERTNHGRLTDENRRKVGLAMSQTNHAAKNGNG